MLTQNLTYVLHSIIYSLMLHIFFSLVNPLMSLMRASRSLFDEPPSPTLKFANFYKLSIDFLNSSLFIPIKFFIILSIVHLSQLSFMSNPICQNFSTNLLFTLWYSTVEFHPLWVKNPPIAWWPSIFFVEPNSLCNHFLWNPP